MIYLLGFGPFLPGWGVMVLLGRPTTEDLYANDHRTRAGPASRTCLLLSASFAGHSQELGDRAGAAGTAGNPVSLHPGDLVLVTNS